jgi:beta-aspartyl-peptidase (threonine type)
MAIIAAAYEICTAAATLSVGTPSEEAMGAYSNFVLAIHGGSGVIQRESLTPASENALRNGLCSSLEAGYRILAGGGLALDAVVATVVVLEDHPLFNAGRGAVFTSAGTQEMDAAVMDGRNRQAGAVAAIIGPRNPILAARAVMERSPHVLLAGSGAIEFCHYHGVPFADPNYFFTEARWTESLAVRQAPASGRSPARCGTVGAVARDRYGNLAAATSTGGVSAKLPGRVGDTPLIGAGTWADNKTCAISATGVGELFIRHAAAHEIAARVRYRGDTLQIAAEAVLAELGAIGGEGGIAGVDLEGAVTLFFNGEGMYRGKIGPDGIALTAIYRGPLRGSTSR